MKAALYGAALVGRVARRGDKNSKDVRFKCRDATVPGSAGRSPPAGHRGAA